MRRFVLLFGLVFVVVLSTLAFVFHDFIRAEAWHRLNGDFVSIGTHRIPILHNWQPAGRSDNLDLPSPDESVIVRAATWPWRRKDSSLVFNPLPAEIESDALAHNIVQAWSTGDKGRTDLAASEFITIRGRLTFYCARRVYRNYDIGLLCYSAAFEYSISSIGGSKTEPQAKAMIASIE